jgi:NitT/TauT family transport system substrate-binding protein
MNKKIVVGALRFTSHAGSFVAVERNYFAEAGLDVELRFFEAAQPMAVAIASGDVDYAVTAVSGGLISLADKGAIKVIGGALSEEAGIDGQKILASDAAFQAGLTSPAMLAGKKFGVTQAGSSFHYMGSKVAEKEGIEMSFTPLQKVGACDWCAQVWADRCVEHCATYCQASGGLRRRTYHWQYLGLLAQLSGDHGLYLGQQCE